jgi:acyl-CoA synthetase (AMP-forming)/AMP-acid ligase II
MQEKIWMKRWNENLTHTLEYPKISIDKLFEKGAEWYPDKPFIIFYGKKLDYETSWRYILGLSSYLKRLGIKKGDRVGISMQNSPNWVISFFGIINAGALAVLLNPMLKNEELEKIVLDSELKLILTTDDLVQKIKGVATKLQINIMSGDVRFFLPKETIVPVPLQLNKEYDRENVISWDEAVKTEFASKHVTLYNTDPAMIAYTSGTTAIPKGCVHTHGSIIANAMASAYWRGVTPATVELSVAPFFHVTGLSFSVLGPLYESATIVPLYRWEREAAVESIEKFHVTHWVTVPTMIADLLAMPNVEKHDFSSLTFVGGGGAAMPKALLERFEKIIQLNFVEGYGMTEMMGQSHVNPTHWRKPGSIGIPQFGVDAKIIDPETLEEIGPSETGEIVFTGPSQFERYYRKEKETKESFVDIDGRSYLRSGDIGYMDEDGFFFVVDRLKRMINRSGFKVWPLEVENVIYRMPEIRECCVISSRDKRVGEEVKAFIVVKPDFEDRITKDDVVVNAKLIFPKKGKIKLPKNANLNFPISLQR